MGLIYAIYDAKTEKGFLSPRWYQRCHNMRLRTAHDTGRHFDHVNSE